MPVVPDAAVAAANALTARWCAALAGSSGTALSGAGVWPLLAVLADASKSSGGTADANALIDLLAGSPATSAALGLWSHPDLPIRPSWRATLRPGVHEILTGQARVDEWVRHHTRGLIERMPLTVTPETLLVLATALTVETTWLEPFEPAHRARPGSGAWSSRPLRLMPRTSTDPSVVRASPTLTMVRVAGDRGVDVHLALGTEDAPASRVLPAALTALAATDLVGGDVLAPGTAAPGVTWSRVRAFRPDRTCVLEVLAFTVRARHDLLELPEVFGLDEYTDRSRGHFSAISDFPLALSGAQQDVVAEFSREGFRAAAVSGFGFAAGAALPSSEAWRLVVTLDRPFGFVAVLRDPGLVVAAGWVTEPAAAPDARAI